MQTETDIDNIEVVIEETEPKKALFIQRLGAYLIDTVLISFVVSLMASFFIDTSYLNELQEQVTEISQNYMSQEISIEEYTSQYVNLYYKTARASGITALITLLLNVSYFVVYQTRTNGQTIGKKLMKIRVVSNEGELFYNQMIFRSLISNSILLNLILFIFMLFSPKEIYFYASVIFGLIQYIIVFVSIFMILNKQDGCAIHDKIVHTKVLREN